MRRDLVEQVIADAFAPRISIADVERAVRRVLRGDPERAEAVVGQMYGNAFKKAEQDYEARGHRGRQKWSIEGGER